MLDGVPENLRVGHDAITGEADACQCDLLGQRALSGALGSDDDQRLALGPQDLIAGAPQGNRVGGGVEDERATRSAAAFATCGCVCVVGEDVLGHAAPPHPADSTRGAVGRRAADSAGELVGRDAGAVPAGSGDRGGGVRSHSRRQPGNRKGSRGAVTWSRPPVTLGAALRRGGLCHEASPDASACLELRVDPGQNVGPTPDDALAQLRRGRPYLALTVVAQGLPGMRDRAETSPISSSSSSILTSSFSSGM